jgi:chromosome segregation ATPase
MQRKITLLEHEIIDLTKDRQFLEKQTNKKYEKQEQLTNQLSSELTNLSTKIKEREIYISKIVNDYNKMNKQFHINDETKQALDEIMKQKTEVSKIVASLENETFIIKSKNINQIEQYKQLSHQIEQLNKKIQNENDEIFKLNKIKESFSNTNTMKDNKEIISEQENMINKLNIEIQNLETKISEKKTFDKLNKIKSLEKELKQLLNQKHHISASNLDIKKQINEIESTINTYTMNFNKLKTQLNCISNKQNHMEQYLSNKNKFVKQINSLLTSI